jgi:hypothetical protein
VGNLPLFLVDLFAPVMKQVHQDPADGGHVLSKGGVTNALLVIQPWLLAWW